VNYTTLAISAALLVGCTRNPTAANYPARPATGPATRDTTRPVTTRPTLQPIDLHYTIYLARLDVHTTITPDGLLRSVQIQNKSFGPNDIDPKNQRVEVRQGRLNQDQILELARLFATWDSLSQTPYGGVADGGQVSIRYGDKTVSGQSHVPAQVSDVHTRIVELTRSMPIVNP
jgi:hypothetical protein